MKLIPSSTARSMVRSASPASVLPSQAQAVGQARHLQAGTAELDVFHALLLGIWSKMGLPLVPPDRSRLCWTTWLSSGVAGSASGR